MPRIFFATDLPRLRDLLAEVPHRRSLLQRGRPRLRGRFYAVAVVIYVVARIVRARQGIDLRAIHHEIPVE